MPGLIELQYMWIPFLACLVISMMHVYLGIHVISRKVIFVDLALAQIAAVGATYATTLGYDPNSDGFKVSLFSLAFTFVGAVAFSLARMRREKVPQEAFIGIIYAMASALAILILSKSATGGEELKHMLVGDILLVSKSTVYQVAGLYAALGLFHLAFRRKFFAISKDPETAEASGINIRFWDILFYMSFGIVITRSVSIAGVLLVFSYLVVPAVVAQMWFDTVRARLVFGWFVALIASTLGIFWSFYSDYPTGPAVVVMLSIALLISGLVYTVHNASSRARALAEIAAIVLFGIVFFAVLSHFRKASPDSDRVGASPADLLLTELADDEESHQLAAIGQLQGLHDARIVPALVKLLDTTTSDQVVEAVVEALGQRKDPHAIPALEGAAARGYDEALRVTIGQVQIALGDRKGFETLAHVLDDGEAAEFARQQAKDLIESAAGRKFGYTAEKSVAENAAAIRRIEEWIRTEATRMRWSATGGVFVR